MSAGAARGPLVLPPKNAAPFSFAYWQSFLAGPGGMGGIGAAMWLLERIAKYRAARFENGQHDPHCPDPGGCWVSARDVGAWLAASGPTVLHEPDLAPVRDGVEADPIGKRWHRKHPPHCRRAYSSGPH